MKLAEISIKRHVLAWMLSGLIALFGIISYQRVGVDRFPAIEFPIITVTTTLKGANPEIIDTSVTSVIESAINTTPGIEHIQSSSSPGASVIIITFSLEKNIDVAFNEVQAKINQAIRRLPTGTDAPVVQKAETNAEPIMWLALGGDRTIQQLNLYALNVLKKKIETINGVGEIRLGGRRDRVIRVHLNPERMAARKLVVSDVSNAFNREHIQVPGGFLVGKNQEYLLQLDLEYHRFRDLGEMVITTRDGAPIRLKDIAQLEDGLGEMRQFARYNGAPTVGIGIIKIPNANTVNIIQEVERRLDEEIRPTLPAGLWIETSSNEAVYIKQMVRSLQEHILEGTLLAALIVWLFLRSLRSTLIVATAIPVSLLGAVAVMYFSGFTFNSMTLLALLLLIGVVVDDAIVVLENIHRHLSRAQQENPSASTQAKQEMAYAAAINGSQEVTFAVIASSLALVCIFAPVIFMQGIMGMFFKSFAVVVTFGVLVSLLISLTLTPMLCSRYLRAGTPRGLAYRGLDAVFQSLDQGYRKLLAWALRHRWKVLLLTGMIVASSQFFFKAVEKEFVPEADEGRFVISFKTPLGSSIDYTQSRTDLIEQVLEQHRDQIASYFTTVGAGQRGQVNQGNITIRLMDKSERSLSQKALVKMLREALDGIPGVKAFPAPVSMVRGQRPEKLQFSLIGNHLTEVAALAKQMQKQLNEIPGMGKLDLDVQLDLPQLEMHIDRLRAASLGISARDIAEAVAVYAGGLDIASYNDQPGDGQRYQIRLKAQAGSLNQVAELNRIFLRASTGDLVRLDSLASFQPTLGAAVIGRYDLQYTANLYTNPAIPLGQAVKHVNAMAEKLLPAGYKIRFTGQAEEFRKTFSNMAFVFALALILLYMVLASQFNAFLQPIIIMLAQPLAIVGGVMALWLSGYSLNIFSMIGLVLLIGLVAKNSILLVDLTNQLRANGASVEEALKTACPIRLRPILMTSLTIILALLPASFGIGAGAETNGPLSAAVIGGMISSTLLTLVVVPAAYSLLMQGMAKLSGQKWI